MLETYALYILLGSFFILVFFRVPLSFALGCSAIFTLMYLDVPLLIMLNQMYTSLNSYPLLAVPFFMLLGRLMNDGGITDRLVRVSDAWVGHIRGGLGHVNVMVSMLFAGLSGSSTADTAGVGSMMIPAMKKAGFDTPFSVAVTAASSTLGVIIPPSIMMVVYASIAQISVGALFWAGVVPGILIGVSQMMYCYYRAKKYGYPRNPSMPMFERLKVTACAIPPLTLPIVILGGVTLGLFTATESAAIAVCLGLILSLGFYKSIKIRDLRAVFSDSAVMYCVSLFMMAMAGVVGWLIAYLNVPGIITEFVTSITTSQIGIYSLLVLILLIMGTFLNPLTVIIAFMPVILALGDVAQIDSIHLGLIVNLVLALGVITPPYGVSLLLASQIGEISPLRAFRLVFPMLVLAVLIIFAGIIFPDLFLFLPRLMMPQAFGM